MKRHPRQVPRRVLLGPGPSEVPSSVLRAMATPLLGHLDPAFLEIMETVKAELREVFQTRNRLTLPLSATGSAGMEAVLVNLLEPGDEAVVVVNGVFGTRMAEIVRRAGAELHSIELPWGTVASPEMVEGALARCRRPTLVALVQAETSTGAWQPIPEIAKVAKAAGALVVVDAVTSLGGCELDVDGYGIDACYSATQKCLSCPPGLSPVTFSERALERMRARKKPAQSWFLDVALLEQYWGDARVYHHTAPISMIYALDEALRLILEEGLEVRWQRHLRNHRALVAGLQAMGLEMAVGASLRLPMLNSVKVPEGIDEAAVRGCLLQRHSVEIGAGLGPWKGKVWRIGLMGESSSQSNVLLVLAALGEALVSQGGISSDDLNSALGAAEAVYGA